jgi:hypothetical protein
MTQDESGQWWFEPPGQNRTRGLVLTCHRCDEQFVCRNLGKNRIRTHCSRKCYAACKKDGLHDNPYRIKRGAENHRWKGGRVVRRGYVHIFMPDHPSIAGRGTTRHYVLEHRLVMEQMLGRLLLPRETVHHKNGVTDDNRPENLELWTLRGQPAGQRVEEAKHCPTCTCGSG